MPGASDLKDWLAIVGALVAVGACGVLWRLRGEFSSRSELKALQDRVAAVEKDLTEIKVLLNNMPDHEDMGDVRTQLARLEEQVRHVGDTMTRIERPLNMLVDHAMRGSS